MFVRSDVTTSPVESVERCDVCGKVLRVYAGFLGGSHYVGPSRAVCGCGTVPGMRGVVGRETMVWG